MRTVGLRQQRLTKMRPIEWDAQDVAHYFDVSLDWVYRNAAAKIIPGYKLAGRWRFDPKAIVAWYEAQKALPELASVVGGAQ